METVTQEGAALALLQMIADAEKKMLRANMTAAPNADREWILTTYAQCIAVVKGADPKEFI